jgi:hypothetical protein
MSASTDHASSGDREHSPRAGSIIFAESAISRSIDRVCTMLAVGGIALLAIRRWILLGPYPPGLDGAQWLALGRGLGGRAIGRSTEGAYAPLTPVLAAIADALAGPLVAVRVLAAASGLALSLAVWFVARGALGPVWGLAVTAIVIPASALAEPMLFGGYPQQLALTAGIVALWSVCRYLVGNAGTQWSGSPENLRLPPSPGPTGRVPTKWVAGRGVRVLCRDDKRPPGFRMIANQKNLLAVGFAALITAAAHHVYFPLVALAILAAVALRLADRSRIGDAGRVIGSLALALTPAFALFTAVAVAFMRAGYAAPLDAAARSSVAAWEYGTREAPLVWMAILASGVVGLAVRWRTRGDPATLLAVSLLMPAGLLFLLSGQPRLLPPILIGAGIAAGLCARWVASFGARAHAAAILLALAIGASLLIPADRATSGFASFYQVVDESLVRAAAAIESTGESGGVAVREDRRGWPVGWWFEALLNRPVIVGSDPRWLAFPEEQEHARQADALFDGGLDAETFRRRAVASGVRFLVVPKWDWIGWDRWLSIPGFPVATLYDDDRYLVLRVT